MNTTNVMLAGAGTITDFFNMISNLAKEYQTAGNGVLIGIALLIIGTKLLVGDDESKARGIKQAPWILLGAAIVISAFNIAAASATSLAF